MSFQQTGGSPTRARIVAFLATLATVAVGLVAAITPSSAAQAGPGDHIVYCEEHRLPDGRLIIPCWVLDELWLPLRPDPDPCLSCPPYAVQFKWTIDPPEYLAELVANGIFEGRRHLLEAYLAEDPKDQKALREQAWDAYLAAAQSYAQTQAQLDVGNVWIHYKEGSGDPDPEPNLFIEFGEQTIAGLDLLRMGLADPKNFEQYEAAAHDAFDQAIGAFVEKMQTG